MKKCLKISLYIPFNYRIFDHLGQFYTMTKIGDIIRLKRIEMGISQKELASQIGVDVSFLCKVEKNEKKLSLEKLELVSFILKLSFLKYKNEYYYDKINSIFENEKEDYKFMIINNIINKNNV
ncbi:transcriptional regulator, y4mF family [Candidatus Ornithobacterium hominis]|uniref:Transcriptional regulator, y4mF family n=2 Tax=Candidatus Ornithobacterium hominis TaxID=2497989 RepID=A0A383U3U7_9FLAO|nr:transcriptional regulator, y4mF family [Candidatus Ornithobacterium hominis]